jgi:Rrf2 family cysteine metabolism transcriptional repressor
MKITYKGDYALKSILDLSFNYGKGEVVPLSDISNRQDIPVKYLEQIMLVLKGAGYVYSKRGVGGGFTLAKSPQRITVGEIVKLIEGPIEPIACGTRDYDSNCGEEECCALREVWLRVTDCISSIVDRVTFADIMRRTRELKEEQMGYHYQI